MQLNFTGRNIELTPALKDYASEKFQKLERRYTSINKVNISFHIEHLAHIAEATLHFEGADFHASAEDTEMYAAIDKLIDVLIGQITKHKEKISGHR